MARSKWKQPYFDTYLVRKQTIKGKTKLVYEKDNSDEAKNIVWSRRSAIHSDVVGKEFLIYNGQKFIAITIKPSMVGHKYGEFSITRKKCVHKKKTNKKINK